MRGLDPNAPLHLMPLPQIQHELRDLAEKRSGDESESWNTHLRRLEFEFEQLMYFLSGARHWLEQLRVVELRILAEAKAPPDGKTTLMLGPESGDEAAWVVDSFLNCARRAQDAIVLYVRRCFPRASLPRSLNKLQKGIAKSTWPLPDELQEIMASYWQISGAFLKELRDLGQHYTSLASEGRIAQNAEGEIGLYLVLPNNPEERQIDSLRFGDPPIHAYSYCRSAFLDLFGFGYRVRYLLHRRLATYSREVSLVLMPKAPLTAKPTPVERPPASDELDELLWECRRALKRDCEDRYGPLDEDPRREWANP